MAKLMLEPMVCLKKIMLSVEANYRNLKVVLAKEWVDEPKVHYQKDCCAVKSLDKGQYTRPLLRLVAFVPPSSCVCRRVFLWSCKQRL